MHTWAMRGVKFSGSSPLRLLDQASRFQAWEHRRGIRLGWAECFPELIISCLKNKLQRSNGEAIATRNAKDLAIHNPISILESISIACLMIEDRALQNGRTTR